MRRFARLLTLLCLPILIGGCSSEVGLDPLRDIAVTFQVLDGSTSQFTLVNRGSVPLERKGWALYFSFGRPVVDESLPDSIRITRINGDVVKLEPSEKFPSVQAGESLELPFRTRWGVAKECDAPAGPYFAITEGSQAGQTVAVADYRIEPIPAEALGPNVPTAQSRYEENAWLSLLPADQVPPIVPTPALYRAGKGTLRLDSEVEISAPEALSGESDYLAAALTTALGFAPERADENSGPAANRILLRLSDLKLGRPAQAAGAEAYRLRIDRQGIEITGSDPAGVFYGIQSLLALMPQLGQGVEIGYATVEDWPRFAYRGMHLDVARNFHSKQSVLKLLDLMAAYKLNRFHFHLADDEGWRLPVQALPELTQVGGRRGHTLDERDRLIPSFGSGPDPDHLPGSGAYSREDFIEILRRARSLHIEVIPEIDMPGHARAAIKSMLSRYHRLAAEGKEEQAREYLLSDLEDQSKYRSIQGWDDNVVNVCQDSTYRFLGAVLDELAGMYREAGAELTTIHTGGDEVPQGVWTDSHSCRLLLSEDDQLNGVEDLADYFLKRFHQLIQARGLVTAGWEEIAFQESRGPGHGERKPHPDFLQDGLLAYVWNTSGPGSQDGAYRLANAGYGVVLCNASNLYFDLAYDAGPQETGYTWGGLVDTRKAYQFAPLELTRGTEGMQSLNPESSKNILGIQGQLWSENAKGPELMEYLTFPKLLGLAERAWAPKPAWASLNGQKRQEAFRAAWNRFANALGQRELPRLDHLFGGVGYRLPPPGAVVEDGVLKANVAFPGLTVRYATDGSEPGPDSSLYQGPVAVEGPVQLRTFDSRGRGSRITAVP